MQCIIGDRMMSFDFNNLNPINKAQAAYKDGQGHQYRKILSEG